MIDLQYIQNLPAAQRKEMLEADALRIDETVYTKPLTPEEILFYKDQLSTKSIEQATILEEKKEAVKVFKDRLEPVAADIKVALNAVKYRAIQCEGRLYTLADTDTHTIHIVDEAGNLINSRMMKPEERQLRLQVTKQISNG